MGVSSTLFVKSIETKTDFQRSSCHPSHPFTAPSHDDILVYDQTFEVDRPRAGLK